MQVKSSERIESAITTVLIRFTKQHALCEVLFKFKRFISFKDDYFQSFMLHGIAILHSERFSSASLYQFFASLTEDYPFLKKTLKTLKRSVDT